MTSAWWTKRSTIAATATGSPKISAHAEKVLLELRNEGRTLVAGADQREEQRRGFGIEGDVADLVDDQQGHASETLELFVEPAGPLDGTEAIDPLVCGRERNPLCAPTRLDAKSDRQMSLARAGRAQEDDVLGFSEEVELCEMGDSGALD